MILKAKACAITMLKIKKITKPENQKETS